MNMSSYNKGATVKTISSSPYLIMEQLRWEGTSRDGLVQPCSSKQGQLELITQDLVQSGVVYIQGYFHNLSGQLGLMFDHSHNKKNLGFFPYVQVEFHVFQFLPIGCGPFSGHHLAEPASIFFNPPSPSGIYRH